MLARVGFVLGFALLSAVAGRAAEWHVTPQGKADNAGSRESPWDVGSALGGGHKVAAGDIVWLHAGVYRYPFEVVGQGFPVRLAGTPAAPVQVRAWPGERVTIDGGLSIQPPSDYLWVRDLEITVTDPRPDHVVAPDPTYKVVNRPWGGLNVMTGRGCKYLHLVIHDNCQGVSFWTPAVDSELYGCLIYDNGWQATDRGHGHAIYTQNNEGTKTIANCIMTGGYGYTMHAYGSSRAFVNNFLVRDNICYDAGTFLIGGGSPSHGIRALGNCLYGLTMQLGYGADNEDCEVRDNTIVKGGLTISKFRQVVNEGNLVIAPDAPRPQAAKTVLQPDRYDPARAHLAIYNFAGQPAVPVDLSSFLKPGDRYRFLDPRDFYGQPLLAGTYGGGALPVPVKGEFAAFVVLRQP